MSRGRLFPGGEPGRLAGLASLTAPDPEEPVSAVVDVAVVGARSDGKTQFILHAIRTLGADAPDDLPEAERAPTHDIMQVVLAAASPRPDANNPDAGVPHYVFRLQPHKLLDPIGWAGRLALLLRTVRFLRRVVILLGALAACATAVTAAGRLDPVLLLGILWLCGSVFAVAVVLARRRFVRRGPIEVVFWDVAGENLYGTRQRSADYWALLKHLSRRRAAQASPERPYGFAPVLICNPLALGTAAEDSPFGRLKPLLPIFASLARGHAEALVVVNRWEAVRGLCPEGADRDERVAVVPEARAGATLAAVVPPTEPLPVVRRGTVRECCIDLEDGRADGVHLTVLRYDAGLCELAREPWRPYAELPESVRARWAEPAELPAEILTYRFSEGARAFEGEARPAFLRWLARLAFRSGVAQAPATAQDTEVAPPAEAAHTLQMFPADEKASGFRSGGT